MNNFLAEFLGTALLILLGDGVVAGVVLKDTKSENAGWIVITVGWALGVTFAIYAVGAISGAHLNPAVTMAAVVRGQMPWSKFLPYFAAQTAGAFCGAATAFFVYREAFHAFDGGVRQMNTAGIFATYPASYLSTSGALIDQIIGTALLMLVISAIGDARNSIPGNVAPLAVGFLVMAIGMAFGLNAGYAINPARDLGPRLFTLVAGWGSQVFTANHYYFWVPIVGPLIGGPLGALVYDWFIGKNFPPEKP